MRYFLAVVFLATLSVAQDYPKAELFGGYSYLNIDTNGLTSRQSANGWEASITGNFTKLFGVEADVAGYYKTYSYPIPGYGTLDVKVTDYSYGAGPRINFRPFFAHALLGGDHLTGSAAGFSESQDGLAGSFGGGVEYPVSKRLAIRASADYVFTQHNIFGGPSYTQNNVRVGGGIVYMFSGAEKALRQPRQPHHVAAAQPRASEMPIPLLGVTVGLSEERGAKVVEVVSGSPAELSGIRVGDLINSVDGKQLQTPMDLAVAISDHPPGSKIKLGYFRRYWQTETTIILSQTK